MAQASIQLLGSFQVQQHGSTVTQFRGDKVRALLTYLAVEADRPHTRSELAGLLWPEQPEEQALRNLTQALLRLRQAFGGNEDPLLVTRQAVQWRDGAAMVDVTAFLRLAESSDLSDLAQAAALYRGEFLTGFGLPDCEAFEDWLLVTRERLGHQVLEVLQRLGEASLAAGQPADAVAAARRQLTLDPWREPAYRQLMRALAQSGDRAGALAAYARCSQALQEELDVTPDDETRELAEQIEAGALVPLAATPGPALPPARQHNLPAPLAALVGREEELAHLASLPQGETRLMTVVGAGGTGKSRLALAAAWALRPAFPDGVWWTELAGIGAGDDPVLEQATVASAVATALGVPLAGRRPPLDELAGVLAERSVLLVLDNCEHLSEVATIARIVLEASPGLCLLATSRERLGLVGETLLPLEGLPVPDKEDPEAGTYPAVRLFVERAARRTPGWGGDPAEVAAAGRLCRVLEGMPLGIELAAHWVGDYTPDEIAEALQSDLTFLTARTDDVPARQRSLQAVFVYSWSLLTETEQQALTRLSVFRGSVDRAPAQAVAGVAPTTLATLVDKSLLRRLEVGRYGFHELLRQFAAERLEAARETTTLGDRHLQWYTALAEQADQALEGSDQTQGLALLDHEHDNLRAALGWSIKAATDAPAHRSETGARLAGALWRFWRTRSYLSEGLHWLTLVRDRGYLPPSLRATVLLGIGFLSYYQGDFPRAVENATSSLALYRALNQMAGIANAQIVLALIAELQDEYGKARTLVEDCLALFNELGDGRGMSTALRILGQVERDQGHYERASRYFTESCTLARSLGDSRSLTLALTRHGVTRMEQGAFDQATALAEESLVLSRDVLKDTWSMAWALCNLAQIAAWQGQLERATALAEESLALSRKIHAQWGIAIATGTLGLLAHEQGNYAEAVRLYKECLLHHRDVSNKWRVAECLEGMARAVVASAPPGAVSGLAVAARLYGAVEALRATIGAPRPPIAQPAYDRAIEALRGALGAEAMGRLWADGALLTWQEAVALALAMAV